MHASAQLVGAQMPAVLTIITCSINYIQWCTSPGLQATYGPRHQTEIHRKYDKLGYMKLLYLESK